MELWRILGDPWTSVSLGLLSSMTSHSCFCRDFPRFCWPTFYPSCPWPPSSPFAHPLFEWDMFKMTKCPFNFIEQSTTDSFFFLLVTRRDPNYSLPVPQFELVLSFWIFMFNCSGCPPILNTHPHLRWSGEKNYSMGRLKILLTKRGLSQMQGITFTYSIFFKF